VSVTSLPAVGAHAGWFLDFKAHPDVPFSVLKISSSDYDGSIEAQMPHGLEGGTYHFVVSGLTNEDYAELYKHDRQTSLCVKLHLYWRDLGALGYFVDLAGLADTLQGENPPVDSLVAVLRVTGIKRQAGARGYEVAIDAREWVYEKLLEKVDAPGLADDPVQAAVMVVDNRKIRSVPSLETLKPVTGSKVHHQERSWKKDEVATRILARLGESMARQQKHQGNDRFGLGMYLIRDGTLKIGPDRLPARIDPIILRPEDGLVEIERREQEPEDPGREDSKKRESFELTLRGRPDIKPGLVVQFQKPPEETDDGGSPVSFTLGASDIIKPGADAWMYVRGVNHRFTREHGFVTVVRGVQVPIQRPSTEFWFRHEAPKASETLEEPRASDSSPDGFLVGVLRGLFGKTEGLIDVAQVRAVHVREADVPPQTETLRRGLAAHDGDRYAATRLAFDEGGALFTAAPYASPFAWGRFGLVLPRYPGMRVLLAHRGGDHDDPLDVGALWESGDAPESLPGDYWLILPADIAQEDREQVEDEQQPADPVGKATNDLIDADGNRFIEVGKFIVRVGAEALRFAGTRPESGAAPLQIEHKGSGSRIVIDPDGSITIHSGKGLTLSAEEDITLDTKKKVSVKVGEFMEVKAR
jgi:hypothetical protein